MEKIKTGEDFKEVIRELNGELRRKYSDFSGITFFGSRARGNSS